jgi:hypothetical protein
VAISILIPIERFSFFVPACVDNIIKTAGVPKDQIDIVFIVSKQATSWVLDAINESNCRKLFVDVPTDLDKGLGLEHQIMLDVAMKEIAPRVDVNLQEVVSICDFFIKDKLPLNRNKVDEIIFSNQKFFKEVKLL